MEAKLWSGFTDKTQCYLGKQNGFPQKPGFTPDSPARSADLWFSWCWCFGKPSVFYPKLKKHATRPL